MNEHDILNRLVDYHDHISVPPVPVAEDLQRGRRRVHRNRGLVAGGVALAVACVVTAVTLTTGGGSSDRPQPIAPPPSGTTSTSAPDRLGTPDPLVAPESLLDVRELGFHVEPVPGFKVRGWDVDLDGHIVTLGWRDVTDADVYVVVHYQGTPVVAEGLGLTRQDDVEVHGVPGRYYSEPEGAGDTPGAFGAHLVWQYAPDAWASIRTMSDHGNPGPKRLRSALLEVAESVSPGGEEVRLPFRLGTLPSSLPQLETLRRVGIYRDVNGWAASIDLNLGDTRLTVGPGVDTVMCPPGYDGGGAEEFTYRGHAGCLSGWGTTNKPRTTSDVVSSIKLQVDGTLRSFEPGHAYNAPVYPIADVKQLLVDLTVAPLDDPSSWFDLNAALGD